MSQRCKFSCVVVARLTFPLGGLVNHRVHLCISGCLTLKLSASWNTVICSPSLYSFFPPLVLPLSAAVPSAVPSSPPSGDIGMVSSGTGEAGLADGLEIAEACVGGEVAAMS